MLKRILGACVVMLVFGFCAGRSDAAFYLRPEVRFGFLADSSADTDVGIGGALGWGGAFGREQRFQVGVEMSEIRYKGEFDYFQYRGAGTGGEWVKKSNTLSMRPVQAAFRYTFVAENKEVRPYVCLSLGYSWTSFDTGGSWNIGACWMGSAGGGVSYRLGRRTSVDLGYRYNFAEKFSRMPYRVRPNAHVFSLAITQLFGRMRK